MSKEPTKTETLLGGAIASVTMRDGKTEEVTIRQLPVKLFPVLLAAQDDEGKLAELYCDKPPGWADALSIDSFEAVITEGERINSDFFSRWVQRRINRQEKMMPGVTARLTERVALASLNGSPK